MCFFAMGWLNSPPQDLTVKAPLRSKLTVNVTCRCAARLLLNGREHVRFVGRKTLCLCCLEWSLCYCFRLLHAWFCLTRNIDSVCLVYFLSRIFSYFMQGAWIIMAMPGVYLVSNMYLRIKWWKLRIWVFRPGCVGLNSESSYYLVALREFFSLFLHQIP